MTDKQQQRTHRAPLTLDERIDSWRAPKIASIARNEKTVARHRKALRDAEQKLAQAQRDLARVDKMVESARIEDELEHESVVPIGDAHRAAQ